MLLLALLLQDATIYGTVDADAAPVYQSFKSPKIPDAILNYLGSPPPKLDDVRAALAPFEESLATLARAARAKRCAWSYPGRDSYAADVPLEAAIAAARLFSARAGLRLESGDIDGALDDVAAGWGVGRHYVSDGPLLPALGGLIALMITEGTLQVRLPGRALSSAQLRRLAAHAEAVVAAGPSFRGVMEGEKRLALDGVDAVIEDMRGLMGRLESFYRKPSEEKKPAKETNEPGEAMWKRLQELLKEDRAASRKILRRRVEEVWVDILRDADKPVGSEFPSFEPLKARSVERWTQFERDGDPQQGLEAAADLYVLLIAPALGKAKLNLEKVRLALALRALWCRVELAERERGAYPESLDGLKPPLDLWDGQPVEYRRVSEQGRRGFILGTRGPNKTWEKRISGLLETDFDYDKFEALSPSDEWTSLILWQLRR